MKKLLVLVVLVGGGVGYYHYRYARRELEADGEVAYVLPDSLPVLDTTAVIRRVVLTLHGGEAVHVTARIGKWASLALPDGQAGWVEQKDLIDAATYSRGQKLLAALTSTEAQAAGHAIATVNLHLEPSRDALKLAEFPSGRHLEIYGRSLVARTPQGNSPPGHTARDVWYLVRSGQEAGWILGRFVDLDVPPGLANYTQAINMVAWLVLDTVNDAEHQVPQYLAADRVRERDVDFNHIRVFTWWVKHHEYVTAYVESGLSGFFPILVNRSGAVPYFRLRLIDDEGHKFQKVYGLYDTIVRPLGTVNGWTSDAMPPPPPSRVRRRKRERRSLRLSGA